MTYLAGDIPVGSYDPNRLANIGIGHAAIDVGGTYTYLNTKTGTEVSATRLASGSRCRTVSFRALLRRSRGILLSAVDGR
jgi:hypothetical protein